MARPGSKPDIHSEWVYRLVPNLAFCIAAATLFYCLVLFDAPRQLFRDSDAGWHIRTGERILTTLTLPRTDPYSFTLGGKPWVAWEWSADVLSGWAHRALGLTGVVMLYVLSIASASWLWTQLNWAAGGNFFLTGLFAAPMLSTANLHWLARPHILSWLFLIAFLCYFETAPLQFNFKSATAIASGSVIWANSHASFFLLPVIAVLYAAGHLLRPLIWDLDRREEFRRALWFAAAAAVAALASIANPYGWNLHRHLFRYLSDAELLGRVGEFQSFNFHADGALQILLALGVSALGGVLALTQKKISHFLLAALFLAVALRSARGLPVVALLLLPLANGALTSALRSAEGLRPNLRQRLGEFLSYADRLRTLDSRLSGLAWSPVLALLALGWLLVPVNRERTGFPPSDFPVRAAALIPGLAGPVRLLAPDKFGGYLIYRFDGRTKVFFDGRSDFYGSGFMKTYIRLVEVRPGWREVLDRQRFTHALLPKDYSLVPALAELGWKETYRDDTAVLLAKTPERTGR